MKLSFLRPLAHTARTATCVAFALGSGAACAKLDPFGAELGKVHTGKKLVRAPYLATVGYFGYFDGNAAAQETVGGRSMQTAYVWLPAATPELGVRVLSPSRPYAKPQDGNDFVTEAYKAHKNDKKGFDPTLVLERCTTVVDPTDLTRPCTSWATLGASEDLATGPNGHEGHDRAELRLNTDPDNKDKALVRGIYRVGISDTSHPVAQGTFFLQLGVPVYLEGAVVAPSLAELGNMVRSKAKGMALVPGIGHAHDQPTVQGVPQAPLPDSLVPAEGHTTAHPAN